MIERAGILNPASAFVWLIKGVLHIRNGAPDIACEHIETSIRLDPLSHASELSRMYLATARFQQGRFGEALSIFRTTSLRLPMSHATLAALHGHLGQTAIAAEELARYRSLSNAPLEAIASKWFHRPDQRERFFEGIALAEPKGHC